MEIQYIKSNSTKEIDVRMSGSSPQILWHLFHLLRIKNFENSISELKQEVRAVRNEIKIFRDSIGKALGIAKRKYLTRSQLSELVPYSERWLRDHPEFKAIERRKGGKIYYIREEVDIVMSSGDSQ